MLSLMFLTSIVAYSQTATAPSVGDGSESNPYEIATLENLYWLTQNNAAWDKHYIQTADIDASTTTGWDSGAGFNPIGNSTVNFTGFYNGKGHVIDGLYIDRPSTDNIGLFGLVDNSQTKIDSLGVTSIDITGNTNIGAIVGYMRYGSISNTFSTGECTSQSNKTWAQTGGFVGNNHYGTITQCYSHVNVNAGGLTSVGGFAGQNKYAGIITNCYSTGTVLGGSSTGGFNGKNEATINNCFWDTETSGQNSSQGGTGLTTEEMKLPIKYLAANWDFAYETTNGTNDYWAHNYSENDAYPFLIWENKTASCAPYEQVSDISLGTITINSIQLNSFQASGYNGATGYVIYINTDDEWTIPSDGDEPTANTEWQNSGQQCIYFGTSNSPNITVSNLDANTRYFLKIYAYNDCENTNTFEKIGTVISQLTPVPVTNPTGDGSENNPYVIANIENLAWLMYSDTAWNKHCVQTAYINASATIEWIDSTGFTPIGNDIISFTGEYNGKGHIIDSLCIDRPSTRNIGLFGYATDNVRIDSLGLTDINITGHRYVGGIIGRSASTLIENCFTTGTVTSEEFEGDRPASTGGLVGAIDGGAIKNCYSHVNVNSLTGIWIGGLLGLNHNAYANINNCYSTGTVTATGTTVGGFAGSANGTLNCFWDTETSGQAESDGGIGLTTAEMKDFKNFLDAEWDFMDESYNGDDNIWGMNSSDNNGYPFLSWQGYSNTETLSCQAPLSAVKEILSEIYATTITIDSLLDPGYGTRGFAIYINSTDTWVIPSDGDEPTANSVWQNTGQQCVYFGISTKPEVNVTGLTANTNYFFKVYNYNDCSGTETYEQTGYGNQILTKVNYSAPSGNGLIENPYVISTLEELTWLMYSDTAWNKDFIQAADIDATETNTWEDGSGFRPIGNSSVQFTGNYNGKGYSIANLFINRPAEKFVGFFGNVNGGGTVDSLGVTNVNITGLHYVGGMSGYNNGTITDCYSTGSVTSKIFEDYSYTGGLVGDNRRNITNCYSEATVVSTNGRVVGGLVGYNYGSNAKISNCYSTGNASGWWGVGGLVGYNRNYASIKNAYSTGNASASLKYGGGLAGINYGSATISISYSKGIPTSGDDKGGLTAFNNYSTYITNCFWDTQTSGTTSSKGGTGLTTARMNDAKDFLEAGWDFITETENGANDYWGINSTENGGYPFLKWQGFTSDDICEAPYSAASNIAITNILPNSATLASFTEAGYGTTGYAIFINTADTWTNPVDGDEPTANTTWQNAGQQCIYLGESNNPNTLIDGLDLCGGGYDYYIKVYAYNTCSDSKVYETTGVVETIVATDNIAPVADVETLTDVVGQCSVTVTDAPTATDACAGSITGTTINPLEYNIQGTYTITWTYDDGNGNTSTQEQTVIVNNEAPVPDAASLDDITGQCSVTVSETPTATDNCSGAITGTTTDPLSYTEQGTYTVTWSYTDENGNTLTQPQTVIVNDDTAPVADVTTLADVTGQCSVAVPETPTATDNCSGAITGTTTDPLSYTEQGTYTVTWSYTDENGNISTQEQTVIVNDNTNPTISCVDNQSKEISATETVYTVSGTGFDPVSTDDNCEVASVENDYNDTDTLNGAEFPLGTTTVIWTVTDIAGNTAECSFDVTISQATGINDFEKNAISIYPNPTTGVLKLDFSDNEIFTVKVYDLLGKVIIERSEVTLSETIDITQYANGVYIISIQSGDKIFTTKIIKK